ncbi:hypothetical protein BGZ91_011047 [Linnemannia elongata]|nr:hypothetical protein BGZ91_011047 [Linnemannia elongata]
MKTALTSSRGCLTLSKLSHRLLPTQRLSNWPRRLRMSPINAHPTRVNTSKPTPGNFNRFGSRLQSSNKPLVVHLLSAHPNHKWPWHRRQP